jgi:limonene-1,2-epoxide hydrolase
MASTDSSGAVVTIEDFMTAFIQAWPTGDASGLGRFFSEDAVFHNGPLPPVHGRDAIVASFAEQMALGGEVSVDIRHMLAEGTVVMTERVDYVTLDDRTIPLRIMGTFEVYGGAITAWRDYFDATEFSSQLAATRATE